MRTARIVYPTQVRKYRKVRIPERYDALGRPINQMGDDLFSERTKNRVANVLQKVTGTTEAVFGLKKQEQPVIFSPVPEKKTNWIPVVAVVGVGIFVGGIYAYSKKKKA